MSSACFRLSFCMIAPVLIDEDIALAVPLFQNLFELFLELERLMAERIDLSCTYSWYSFMVTGKPTAASWLICLTLMLLLLVLLGMGF